MDQCSLNRPIEKAILKGFRDPHWQASTHPLDPSDHPLGSGYKTSTTTKGGLDDVSELKTVVLALFLEVDSLQFHERPQRIDLPLRQVRMPEVDEEHKHVIIVRVPRLVPVNASDLS